MSDQKVPQTGWAMHTRKGRRHAIPPTQRVYVDFDDPRLEKRWRVRLLDISVGGLSFPRIDDTPSVEAGDVLRRAVIHSGGWKILGQLEVTYATAPCERRSVCGAAFDAASDADRLRLKTMIAALARDTADEDGGLCPPSLELQT